ncbi:hypothetical protein B0G83_1401, partial [Paraburkholderia sp. BL21I4N1]
MLHEELSSASGQQVREAVRAKKWTRT